MTGPSVFRGPRCLCDLGHSPGSTPGPYSRLAHPETVPAASSREASPTQAGGPATESGRGAEA
jgi:hypothetical protein